MARGRVRYEVAGLLDDVVDSGDKVETLAKKRAQVVRRKAV